MINLSNPITVSVVTPYVPYRGQKLHRTGTKHTEETKKKISVSQKLAWTKRKVI